MNATNQSISTSSDILPIIGGLELCIALLGTPINIVVIIISVRLMKSYTHRNKILILSMAVADVTLCCFHAPLMAGQFSFQLGYLEPLCTTHYFVTYVCNIASSLSLLALNVDKFYKLHKPLLYNVKVSRAKLTTGVSVSWITSVTWTSLFLFGPATSKSLLGCGYEARVVHVYTAFTVIFFMLPNFVSFCLSCFIAFIVMRSQVRTSVGTERRMLGFRQKSAQLPRGSVHRRKTLSTVSTLQVSIRSIVFVFSTTIWSVCTTLPYRLAILLTSLGILEHYSTSSIETMLFLFLLMSANSFGNPLITVLTQRVYGNSIRSVCSTKLQTRTTTIHSSHLASSKRTPSKRSLRVEKKPSLAFESIVPLVVVNDAALEMEEKNL